MKDRRNNQKPPVSEEKLQEIVSLIKTEITERPPTIGLIGVSGVGKSSTINTLFKTQLATSDTVACTKVFTQVDLSLEFLRGQMQEMPVSLRVFDAPGLGEDIAKDPEYLEQYELYLDKCDVVLWVMSARNRAVALDQQYLEKLARFQEKMVFGVNQVDIVEPINWREGFNIPSREQEENIKIILNDRTEKIKKVVGRDIRLICYSAKRGYRLEPLFKMMLDACPLERRWIYEGLKNFNYMDFIPNNFALRAMGFLAKNFS
jgi:small GTP-binding protein